MNCVCHLREGERSVRRSESHFQASGVASASRPSSSPITDPAGLLIAKYGSEVRNGCFVMPCYPKVTLPFPRRR